MRKTTYLILLFGAVSLTACSSFEQKNIAKNNSPWTLEFTLLKNDKPIDIKTYEFQSRVDCFNAMYRMQTEAKKVRYQSGAGLCYKEFADGQERTGNDQLMTYSH